MSGPIVHASFANRKEPQFWAQFVQRSWLPRIVCVCAVALGIGLIVSTYPVFNQTFDEPAHIAAGMQWLDLGRYTYEPMHPPIARVFTAVGPYAAGARSHGIPDMWLEGNAILGEDGTYQRNLTLARMGILPFFVIACVAVWAAASSWLGEWPAAATVVLFASCPPVLAHSGLATTDLPAAAMVFAALVCFRHAITNPMGRTAMAAGMVWGLAIATKFSAIPFLIVCGSAMAVHSLWQNRAWKRLLFVGVIMAVSMAAAIWGAYRFSVAPLGETPDGARLVQNVTRHAGPLQGPLRLAAAHVPARDFFRGLNGLRMKLQAPLPSYLLGQTTLKGHWYFFPVTLAVKTPLPLLILCWVGFAFGVAAGVRGDNRAFFAVCGLLGPLIVAAGAHINLGVRHVLLVYPFMGLLAALAICRLWQVKKHRLVCRCAIGALLLWQVVGCLRAAPDWLPYFNELAAPHADQILVDSDLDWGQDLRRLSIALKELGVAQLTISYFGTANPSAMGLPPCYPLLPNQQAKGWVAISETNLKLHAEDYAWLERYRPVRMIGHSIRLYYIP